MATDFSSKELSTTYSEGVIAEELFLRPVVMNLVGDVNGKSVLDIGCGDGRYSIFFAEAGARVTAIDLSSHQIELAERKNPHASISYRVDDVASNEVVDNSMDIVFANLVVPDLEGKQKLMELFSMAKRVLNNNGRFIFSTIHPFYLCSDQDGYDKAVGFKSEDYFNEGVSYPSEALTKSGNKMHFNETHFSLTFISTKLKEKGFLIKSLVESRQVPEKSMFWPKYLVFDCVPSDR